MVSSDPRQFDNSPINPTTMKSKLLVTIAAATIIALPSVVAAPKLPAFLSPEQLRALRAHHAANREVSASVDQGRSGEVSTFYTGRVNNTELGEYLFMFRSYDSGLTRWTTPDPSGFPDGANISCFAPVPTSQIDFAGLMSISWTTNDAISPGETTQSISVKTAGTVMAAQSGNCWYAVVNKPFEFTGTGTITLPKVGESYTDGGQTGVFDSVFHGTTAVHEGWHRTHADVAASRTYTILENWSSIYSSNLFKTQAAALAAGNADFASALALTQQKYSGFWSDSVNHVGANPATYYHYDSTVDTWRSVNPNWGGSLKQTIESFQITYQQLAGNGCE